MASSTVSGQIRRGVKRNGNFNADCKEDTEKRGEYGARERRRAESRQLKEKKSGPGLAKRKITRRGHPQTLRHGTRLVVRFQIP
jgi:hypothetical protein